MNDKKIKQILGDLYKIDKNLKEHESDLMKIISKMIEVKPDTDIDDAFVGRVREELVLMTRKVDEVKTGKNLWTNFSYALGGGAVMLLFFVLFFNSVDLKNNSNQIARVIQQNNQSVKSLQNKAFGDLSSSQLSNEESSSVPIAETGIGLDSATGGGGSASVQVSEKMIARPIFDSINYNFVYDGEGIGEIEQMLTVYRRVDANQIGGEVVKAVGSLDLLDINNFQNLSADSFNFSEDRDFGYNIYYNLKDNRVSIGNNYEKWPNIYEGCQDENCYLNKRLKIDDVMSDDEAVRIADKFLNDYKIDKNGYGVGEVSENWLIAYEKSLANGSDPYIPESKTVVYPMIIEGEEVLDESGGKTGMRVEVSNRYSRVTGVYDIRYNQFEGSKYEVLNDVDKLINFAEQGGLTPMYKNPDAEKQVDVMLGTPSINLISYWRYGGGNGVSEELYIPALVFPVKEKPTEGYFYTDNVVIPLVKEIIEKRLGDYNNIQVEPMPLLKEMQSDAQVEEDSANLEVIDGASGSATGEVKIQGTQLRLER